jgi:hypothetical protein
MQSLTGPCRLQQAGCGPHSPGAVMEVCGESIRPDLLLVDWSCIAGRGLLREGSKRWRSRRGLRTVVLQRLPAPRAQHHARNDERQHSTNKDSEEPCIPHPPLPLLAHSACIMLGHRPVRIAGGKMPDTMLQQQAAVATSRREHRAWCGGFALCCACSQSTPVPDG